MFIEYTKEELQKYYNNCLKRAKEKGLDNKKVCVYFKTELKKITKQYEKKI
ncbi:MAG: hypothetical protein PHD31_02675 [Candidatus Pacebacteria bacterium]|jgi:hypothetical protein|nr:hypothetical protein [Candidatus Paceibacterota bacterium]